MYANEANSQLGLSRGMLIKGRAANLSPSSHSGRVSQPVSLVQFCSQGSHLTFETSLIHYKRWIPDSQNIDIDFIWVSLLKYFCDFYEHSSYNLMHNIELGKFNLEFCIMSQ